MVYLKSNSLQQHQAASFGLSQSKVSTIAKVLLTSLNQALSKLQLSPVGDAHTLRRGLDGHFNHLFPYDGIEWGIQRNAHQDAQEQEFTGPPGGGKKKPSPEKQSFV